MPSDRSTLALQPIACIECRRLKRKCDRRVPCNICTRHAKTCRFATPKRQSLARPSPYPQGMLDLADLCLSTGSGELVSAGGPSSHAQALPVARAEPANTATSPHQRSTHPPASPLASMSSATPMPVPAAAELLEKQPQHASGYEWNERQQSAAGHHNDGTASLSVEPDGSGYFGFASGATLLRILQIVAGGVSIAHVAHEPDSVQSMPALPLSSHQSLARYLDGFFEHYHPQYPIVHKATFLAQWAQVIPRPPKESWSMLSNVVLGLGAFCVGAAMSLVDELLDRAFDLVKVGVFETGSLTFVQAFCLLSNLAQKRDKPNAGSICIGIAVRMALALGLHRELPLWNITPFEREVRRRVWWVVFIFDAGASITFGRPILLPQGEADVRVPQDVPDDNFTPQAQFEQLSAVGATNYTSLIHQARFCLLSNRIYTTVIGTPGPTSVESLALDDGELAQWAASLPVCLSGPWHGQQHPVVDAEQPAAAVEFSAHKLFWRYSNLQIILYRRAFLEQATKGLPLSSGERIDGDADAKCAERCLLAALQSISSIKAFFESRTTSRLESWYGLHFLFQSAFVPLIALHVDPFSPARGRWLGAVREAESVLAPLQDDALARRCLRIIGLLGPHDLHLSVPAPERPAEAAQGSTSWFDGWDSMSQGLLPFADATTLASFWPFENELAQ